MAMHVTDVMHRPVVTVRPDDTIEQAATVLTKEQITAAPVVDALGGLVGMVSESDLLLREVPPSGAVRNEPPSMAGRADGPVLVADVMTEDVVTLPANSEAGDVAEAMLAYDVRSIPILGDEAQLVGIVSRRDLLRSMVPTSDNARVEVQHRLDEYAGGVRRWTAMVANETASITGPFDDATEQRVARALALTVPGVSEVDFVESEQ
jgi:CBS domain-containing protein